MSVEFGGRTSGRCLAGITRPTTTKVKQERNPRGVLIGFPAIFEQPLKKPCHASVSLVTTDVRRWLTLPQGLACVRLHPETPLPERGA
jgi:hypothetical protein